MITEEFIQHFKYLIKELYRVLKPGRLISIHCMNLPTVKSLDGYIGIKDFRGDIIKSKQKLFKISHENLFITTEITANYVCTYNDTTF